MSAQIGRWHFDGAATDPAYRARADSYIAAYGPDSARMYERTGFFVLYHAFHTTSESLRESQPRVLPSGAVLTWDGRLDNRDELVSELSADVSLASSDVDIVGAAMSRWKLRCLPRIIGDWALSLWDPTEQTLILAKDFSGTRHLFYKPERNAVSWSTVLEPLVVFSDHPLKISQEYIAGCLGIYPATHLTPYEGIVSVPPSHSVVVRPGRITTARFWEFDSSRQITYRSDSEYEEHFRSSLATSVRRRLRSDRTVLAELSGGMDSSTIVSVADHVNSSENSSAPLVETISYFSDEEPNWNERPFFAEVERKRGKVGCHIDVRHSPEPTSFLNPEGFPATPLSLLFPTNVGTQFADCVAAHGSRVLLSGIGGDEFTGGVPTPLPELLDLMASARFRMLFSKLKVWATLQRRPWTHIFFDTVRCYLPHWLVGVEKNRRPAPWLSEAFIRRNGMALEGYPVRLRLLGARPSFQDHLDTLDGVRRQIASAAISARLPMEIRYPFLDRDLLEFLFAIPREQIVRPGQRRSLMRRALVGIVPAPILERKRKAYVSKSPFQKLAAMSSHILGSQQRMVMEALHIVDRDILVGTVRDISRGANSKLLAMLRTLNVEIWLRELERHKIISGVHESFIKPAAFRSHSGYPAAKEKNSVG